jgi:putative intracellular protease/amidase
MSKRILIISTSHDRMGDTGRPTGVWIEELTTPYYALADAGLQVDIASIKGGPAPIEPNSQKALGENTASVDRYLCDAVLQQKLRETSALDSIDTSQYHGLFLPGGHGTMWDYPQSATLARMVGSFLDEERVVAAVCHGPAGLVSAKLNNGQSVVAGRRVSAFTNSEEEAVGLTGVVPFLLETRLRELGADFVKTDDFQPFAVADGALITGQNPASAERVAALVLKHFNLEGRQS